MSAPRTVLIELSDEHAKWIDDRVARGEFPDEAAAVREGLDELAWSRSTEVEPGYVLTNDDIREAIRPVLERWKSGDTTSYTLAEVRAHFREQTFRGDEPG